jgi:hypothetical protein
MLQISLVQQDVALSDMVYESDCTEPGIMLIHRLEHLKVKLRTFMESQVEYLVRIAVA